MSGALWSIRAIGRGFREGSLSPVTLIGQLLNRIETQDPALGSFHLVMKDAALEAAAKAEAEFAAGNDHGPLQGIPYAVVDMIDVAGVPTRCGSRITSGHIARDNAHVVDRLAAAGAVVIGKAATFEFATGGPGADSLCPPTRNPWNLSHSAGASGAGAAIAAGFVPLALGIDTGGAVRGSAALCGVVGLKPSYGLLSRRGVFPLSRSFDHIGLLAANVADVAIGLEAAIAFDPADLDCVDASPSDLSGNLEKGIRGTTIGMITDLPGVDSSVTDAVEAAADIFQLEGARIEKLRLEFYEQLLTVGETIYSTECYAIHEKDLCKRPQLYGQATRDRLLAGAIVRDEDYVNAQRLRHVLTSRLNEELFSICDVVLLPAAPGPAPKLDGQRYGAGARTGVMTLPFNVTGHPAISVCCGASSEGLPLGLQLIARPFEEAMLLRTAKTYENAAGWKCNLPPKFRDEQRRNSKRPA